MKENNNEKVKPEPLPELPPLKPKKRKKKWWLVIMIIVIILLGVGYFFRKPILNKLKTVPFVGQLIPSVESEKELSKEELVTKAQSQESELATLKSQIDELERANGDLKTKNDTLKVYETQYSNFLDQKEAWDEDVAKTNTDLFIAQFEKVYPETAASIYEKLKDEEILTKEQETLSKSIAQMDEDQAAKALEVLLPTDPELVDMIISGMKDDQKATILSSMSSAGAAQVIKLLSPEINTTP